MVTRNGSVTMKIGHQVSSSSAFLRATKESCFHRVTGGVCEVVGGWGGWTDNLICFIHIHALMRWNGPFSHSGEQKTLINTNVWIVRQRLIMPLGGIIEVRGIIGTRWRATLGRWLPMEAHRNDALPRSWFNVSIACRGYMAILNVFFLICLCFAMAIYIFISI